MAENCWGCSTMNSNQNLLMSRTLIYLAMMVVLVAICVGAYRGAPPVYLAVGFIGEIVLVSTAHLSSVIQQCGLRPPTEKARP